MSHGTIPLAVALEAMESGRKGKAKVKDKMKGTERTQSHALHGTLLKQVRRTFTPQTDHNFNPLLFMYMFALEKSLGIT